jgi:hypothetical protein
VFPGSPKGEASPNGTCRGACKGDRAAFEGPAKFARTGSGQKVVWCPCCGHALREIAPGAAAPNVLAIIDQSKRRRFTDDACGYNVELLPDLKVKA